MVFLVGKVALVTGGAGGIGSVLIQKLLECGVKGIGLVDIAENGPKVVEEFEPKLRDKIIFIKADVTVQEEFEDAFEKTINKFKQLDIVINNAGITNEVQWEKTVAVNLVSVIRGTFLALDKYLPRFKSGEEGVIVNTASVLGLNAMNNAPVYTATKHGVIGLGRSLGSESSYEKNKIRIITICPGLVATPLIKPVTFSVKDVEATLSVKDVEATIKELATISKIASSTNYIGDSVIKLINEAKHGSFWVLEDEETPYEVAFPYRTELSKSSKITNNS